MTKRKFILFFKILAVIQYGKIEKNIYLVYITLV